MFFLKLIFTVILADFVSGLVHWLEDAYARPGMPLFGRIAEENLQHHARPRAFLAKSWWESSHDLLLLGLMTVLLTLTAGIFTGWVLLFVVLTINANQIHKWAHQGPRENPALVTLLQKWQVLQTPREHARHHRGSRDSHYCVITNVLNPVLESVGFWRRMESLIESLLGMRRRNDADYASSTGR
jgi:ubiquitin-conjugating enzyme E2 variant